MDRFQHVLAIANPSARSGRNRALMDELRAALTSTFPKATLRLTEHPNHASAIAAAESEGVDLILACGGDGTVHEVAKGLVSAGSRTPMGVLGMGSGNDFARALQMPVAWKEALTEIAGGKIIDVDTGQVRWSENGEAHEGFFINALGIGFDAHSAVIAPKYKGYPLGMGYTLAILQALRTWVSGGATIRENDRSGRVLFSGRLMFATVGNAFDSGGGYTVNPGALVTDGALDPCIVEHISTFRSIMLMPKVRSGRHVENDEVVYERVKGVHVDTDRGLPVHADGEILSLQARDLQVSVAPSTLRTVVPAHVELPI